MKCPECGSEKRFYNLGSAVTLLGSLGGVFVEDGVEHSHDPNKVRTLWECAACRHKFNVESRIPCPVEGCDYGKEEWE